MKPSIYTVPVPGPGRLSTMAKPRAGDWLDDEMHALADLGVTVVVSLLTDNELSELGLHGEGLAAESTGLAFRRLSIVDRGVPDRGKLTALVTDLVNARQGGGHVVVHCRYGIGRSSLVAAAVLVAEGLDPERAWQLIGDARGRSVPDTDEQRWFIEAF